MDVKSTFLNAFLEKEVYVNKPEGYIMKKGHKEKILKLKKVFYDLK